MKKKWLNYKKISLIVVAALIITISAPTVGHAITNIQKQLNLFSEVYKYISYYHVSNPTPEELTQAAIKGMISELDDPYTVYFTDEEYNSFIGGLNQHLTGIGVYVQEKDGFVLIESPIKGSPAEDAGLLPGDLIIGVDGKDIKGMKLEDATSLIKGDEGTNVILTIRRNFDTFNVTVARKRISVPVADSRMLTSDIGYLKLSQFSLTSAAEFKKNLTSLEDQGMQKLVIDLRGNPGGYLSAAINIAENFIAEGPIVHVKNKYSIEQSYSAHGGTDRDLPIVVLVNKNSASAAEILTGALKDYDKAVVLGENSFGKGTVQQLIDLQNGGHLKLTIEEYFTPDHHKMNGVGIQPDIKVEEPGDQLPRAVSYLEDDAKIFKPEMDKDIINILGKNYIALRPMVEAFGGKTVFNNETKTTSAYLGDEVASFSGSDESVKVIDGVTYVEVEKLKDNFKKLIIIQESGLYTLIHP